MLGSDWCMYMHVVGLGLLTADWARVTYQSAFQLYERERGRCFAFLPGVLEI